MPAIKQQSKLRGVPFQDWQVRALLAGSMSQFRVPCRCAMPDVVASSSRPLPKWMIETFSPYQLGEVRFIRETWEPIAEGIRYRADGHDKALSGWWRPPQHCRAVASRFRIEITSVGVGWRQEISEEDAEACGITSEFPDCECDTYAAGFAHVWDAQHAAKGNGWAENGLDWRFDFRLIRKDEDDG